MSKAMGFNQVVGGSLSARTDWSDDFDQPSAQGRPFARTATA